jgi:hypothetical protein|tara:strand:- start:2035 stop:2268 length:234 start_codon:yes stop_codon:yes gene_type:complete
MGGSKFFFERKIMGSVKKRCPECKAIHVLENINIDKLGEWLQGGLIQNCFPELSATEREILKTGICEECWDKMFLTN